MGDTAEATVRLFHPWRLVAVVVVVGLLVVLFNYARHRIEVESRIGPPLTEQERAEVKSMNCRELIGLRPVVESNADSVDAAREELDLIDQRLRALHCS